jgi:hypothetical protein
MIQPPPLCLTGICTARSDPHHHPLGISSTRTRDYVLPILLQGHPQHCVIKPITLQHYVSKATHRAASAVAAHQPP